MASKIPRNLFHTQNISKVPHFIKYKVTGEEYFFSETEHTILFIKENLVHILNRIILFMCHFTYMIIVQAIFRRVFENEEKSFLH